MRIIKSESKNGVNIIQVDAKDLYLADAINREKRNGLSLSRSDGNINLYRFSADLPYSLELIELRKVYEKVYRNKRFSFFNDGKEYTKYIVSVTYNYSVREFNRIKTGVYIREGYSLDDVSFTDNVCIKDGALIAVKTDKPFLNPIDKDILGSSFLIEDGCYKFKPNSKTIHTVANLRRLTYENGLWIDGIHYVRYKRSAGSARVGKCVFIAEPLYRNMHKWELCGLNIKEGDSIDLAGFESYISLTMSSIIGMIEILPENILLIDDYDSTFKDKVVNVKEIDNKLIAEEEEVSITNTIHDGQSLIDPSLMGKYSNFGFILLRNKFFKSAAFNFNIQQFFADHGITKIEQLNGITRAKSISDIKLITTPSSVKYMKFGTFDEWLDNTSELFGVVKHEKPTHFFNGEMVQVHYQLLNSLQMSEDEVKEFLTPTLNYIELLRNDPAVMRHHIKFGQTEWSDEPNDDDYARFTSKSKNDIVYTMLGITDEFTKTKLYADFRHEVIKSFVRDAKCGHILCNGNYSVLCGNPIEMAMLACGIYNGENILGVGNVYSTRFKFGQRLLGSRSPHVASGNVLLTNNKDNELIRKYCNVTPEIVVVNSIDENILSRLSGADFDSDTMMLTDNPVLIRCAERNYKKFLVPTGSVKSVKKKRVYNAADKCDLDIAVSFNYIGEIVNLSQELNTKYWHNLNNGASDDDVKKYYLDAALLDVLSNIEIDRAKREFTVNSQYEIKNIKKKYEERDKSGRSIKPSFFGHISKKKGYYNPSKKYYKRHDTAMDYVQKYLSCGKIDPRIINRYLPFSSIITPMPNNPLIDYDEVERILKAIKESKNKIKRIWASNDANITREMRFYDACAEQQRIIDYIYNITMTASTMKYLLIQIEYAENTDIQRIIFYSLFGIPNKSFYKMIIESKSPIKRISEVENNGDVEIYGKEYSYVE